MGLDFKQYICSCSTFAQTKKPQIQLHGLLQLLSVPALSWSVISIDFIVDLSYSEICFTMMVVLDVLTKMAHFIPTWSVSIASETANLFLKHIFCLYGFPSQVLSNCVPQFISHFWYEFCRDLGMEPPHLSTYHLQTSRQMKHVNQTLEQ